MKPNFRNIRTGRFGAAVAALVLPLAALAAPIDATLYKNPQCGCCDEYAKYLHANGFEVTVKPTHDLARISHDAGMPQALEGCHTMFVGGYVVEGLVPVDVVRQLLAQRPAITGITLPGMPAGAPGMQGTKTEPLTIYAIARNGGTPTIYAVR